MCKKLLIFTFFCFFLAFSANSQEPEHVTKGKINIKSIIFPMDSTSNYVIYRKNTIIYKDDKGSFKEKKFFINVPKGLKFVQCKHKGKINFYVFSNSEKYFVVEIHSSKVDKIEPLACTYKEMTDSSLKDKIQWLGKIEDDKYCGIYSNRNYFLYYCNINKDEIDLYDKCIQSLRSQK